MSDEALLYLRKSKGRTGISRQRVMTATHLGRDGRTVRDEYVDTDSTAYAKPGQPPPPRKDFARLVADLPRHPGITIAAWHADRILRNPEETEVLIRACLAGGHLITTARGGDYDVKNANGRKRLRDDANDAAAEVDHNRERILAMKAEMAAEGRWGGGPRPFGFGFDREAPGGLVHCEAEARAAAAAADDLLDHGGTLYGVCYRWSAAGISGTAGGYLPQVNIRKILLNPRLAGLMPDGVTRAQWEPVIPEDRWRLLAALLTDEARHRGPGPQRSHLLTGIGLCGECGQVVVASPGCDGYQRYRCSAVVKRRPGRKTSKHVTARLEPLDAMIQALAVGRLKQEDASQLLREDHAAERTALRTEGAVQKALFDEQWDLYRAKAITARELTEGRAGIEAERGRIRSRLAEIDAADVLAPMLADPEGAWDDAPVEQRCATVAALMHVTVFHARRGRPDGWRPGEPYFDAEAIDVRWKRRLPSDG